MSQEKEEDRQSFFSRLDPTMSRRALSFIKLAYQIAKFNHRWQTRKQTDAKGEPIRYFEHLRGVALILIDEIGCQIPEMIIAALLHDLLEDTKNVTEDDLEIWFGEYGMEVCRLVRLLSKKPKVDYLSRLSIFGDWRVLLLKACDRLHNLRSLEGTDQKFQRKIADETLQHYLCLLGHVFTALPLRYIEATARAMFEIERLAEKHASPDLKRPNGERPPHWRFARLVNKERPS